MKNLHFRVITMVIGLYFTGTMTNPSRKSRILFNSECQWNGYLLTNCSFAGKHEIPVDISQIAATVDVSSSFFRVLLQTHMKKEEWNIKHLDLSNNLISKITLSSLAHFHALEILNLSNNAIHSVSLDLLSFKSLWVKRHRGSLRNGLPFLKLLILQRNKLSDIPKGLWKLKSLQSLDLSFNGITQIGLSDFHNCLQLENLHLKSNKIFRIHPEAFKDLKKLQVVDLSNNALTAILPMMMVALELPHLEADLAGNQWQCDYGMAVFQNVISESWRRKWNAICNKSIGKEEAYWWTPTRRASRETHLPRTNLNRTKSLTATSKAERPWEVRFSTLRKKDPAGSDTSEGQRRLPRRVRSAGDVQAAGRREDASQDLALAVCLSVFITFFVAFCLGAFARPYVDRLWQQRCRKKSPGSGNVYSNQGFYDEIVAVGNTQQPRMDLRQTFHGPNLCENQAPHAAVTPARTRAPSSKEAGGRQGGERCGDHTGAGSGKDNALPNHGAARPVLRGRPNADDTQLMPAGQDCSYRYDIPGEVNYDTVAREDSLGERSMGIPAVAARLQTSPGSIHKDSNELGPPLPREMATPVSQMVARAKALRTGEKERRGGTPHFPSEFSKENVLSAQQQRLEGAGDEEEPLAHCGAATLSDPGATDPSPPVCAPGWGHDLHVTPANKELAQKDTPDAQYELDTDSDEGSLFTLSSTSSEDWRNVAEAEARGEESCRANEPRGDEDSGERRDNVVSLESLEDSIAFQKILGKCENQEDRSGKTLISDPDYGLYEAHPESRSNTNKFEDPLTLPRSLGNSPCGDEIPGMSIDDCVTALQSKAAEWQCSLRDLEFSVVDVLPQTPTRSAEVPSDPDESVCGEGDADIFKYEPYVQGVDTAQSHIPSKMAVGKNLRPSRQDSEEDNMNGH
ncbi:leucine-rich repeat-containing protein 66 isoform X1 [Balaenoptera acutorostrata]|uniref:Leucine-rich repeat-containing protein 66 isoform X1 n=1 Tax=Balaenoptera acutorostrata TaxID=9767 RepID=A0A384A0J5_BALAC|nr:leucine-rich repeat-containing protein 66 isoform X1 [Balaenoptera acutorostrata]XP_057402728.1 leucine-rich repeat-containing protein 66 isoform X1 [Balaenoptera acutorostrata]